MTVQITKNDNTALGPRWNTVSVLNCKDTHGGNGMNARVVA